MPRKPSDRCGRGHEISGDNAVIKTDGTRQRKRCRTCLNAYKRAAWQRKTGPTLRRRRKGPPRKRPRTLFERLLSRAIIDGDCWIWTGSTNGRYGRLEINGRTRYAHMATYELLRAPIPTGASLAHLCGRPLCINPAHLDLRGGRASVADRLIRLSVDRGDCRVWIGKLTEGGYGYIRVGARSLRAHRVSYETFVGPIPEALELDHLCRNPACIKPGHLEAVTHAENIARSWSYKTAGLDTPSSATHCINGHERTPENTRERPRPNDPTKIRRTCRVCDREAVQQRRAQKKAAIAA